MLWLCVISISLWRTHLRSKANQLCLIIPVWICVCDSVHSMLILTNDWYSDNSALSENISMSYTAARKWHKWLWCLRFEKAALSNRKAKNLAVIHISQQQFIWSISNLWGVLLRTREKGVLSLVPLSTFWINNQHYSVQQRGRGFSALASWLCRLNLGSIQGLEWWHVT